MSAGLQSWVYFCKNSVYFNLIVITVTPTGTIYRPGTGNKKRNKLKMTSNRNKIKYNLKKKKYMTVTDL